MNPAISFLVDSAIVVAYLGCVLALGIWVGRGKKSLDEYLLGGRDLPWWAILGSIVATETSTATFLSVPAIAFSIGGDLQFLQLTFGYIIGRWIVVVTLLPLFFRGRLLSAYEVLEQRFGSLTKQTASVMFLITRNLGDGLRLFLTAIVLEKSVGLPLPLSVVVIGVVTIVYTFFGGMKSVVWNDCLQFIIYIAGGIVALMLILQQLPGGWQQFCDFGVATGRFQLFNFDFSLTEKYTIWSGVIGGIFLSLGTHGTDQMMVQTLSRTRVVKEMLSVHWDWSGFVVLIQFALFSFVGIGLAAFGEQYPPSSPFQHGDSVFAHFIVTRMPTGIMGLTLAAVIAGDWVMSTLSSSLNSSATAALNDLYLPRKGPAFSGNAVSISRVLTVLFGIVQIGVGIAAARISQNVVEDALAIAGFVGGIMLGVFALAVYAHRTQQRDALIGILTGAVVVSFVKFGTPIAWPWYSVIGAASTIAGAWGSTLLQRRFALIVKTGENGGACERVLSSPRSKSNVTSLLFYGPVKFKYSENLLGNFLAFLIETVQDDAHACCRIAHV